MRPLIVAASEDEAAPFEDARAGLFGRPALPRAAADVGFSEVSPERARELFPNFPGGLSLNG